MVVAFPPTLAGSNPVVLPPTASAPAISGACLSGCVNTANTIAFTVGTGGTFQVVPTGYPAPKLTETGSLPSGITMNSLTGILGGTPASGTSGSFPISFTATNSTGTTAKLYAHCQRAEPNDYVPGSLIPGCLQLHVCGQRHVNFRPHRHDRGFGSLHHLQRHRNDDQRHRHLHVDGVASRRREYGPALNVVRTVTASLASQAISFAAPASPAAYNSTFAVSATSTSGLAVTIAASGVCTVSSGTVTMTSGTGTCTLTASQPAMPTTVLPRTSCVPSQPRSSTRQLRS